MKRSLLISFLLFLALGMSWAQEEQPSTMLPDSLVSRLKENRGTDLKRVEALNDAIMFFFNEHKIVEATAYINELEEVANNIHDNYWIATSHYFKALRAYDTYNNAEFFVQANEALRIAETLRTSEASQLLLARIYQIKSASLFNNNLLPECQECIDMGLQIANNNGLHDLRHGFLINLGSLYIKLENYDQAIKIFKDLLKEEFDLLPLLDIANTFVRLQQFDSVLYYTDSIINHTTNNKEIKDKDLYFLISAYQVKAVGLIKLNRSQEAIQCLDESTNPKYTCDDKSLLLTSFLHRSEALNDLEQYELALDNINKAIELAQQTNLIEAEWYATKVQSDILENMGNFQDEIESMHHFISLSDTIKHRENIEELHQQKFQREALALEQELSLERQILKQRQRYMLILASLIFFVCILIVTIIMLYRKRRQEKTQASLDARNREVTTKTMEQIHFNNALSEIVTTLTHYVNNPKGNPNAVNTAIHDLNGLIDDGSEKDFDFYFTQIHPDFYKKLQADFPDLTPYDLRLCAFIKNNLNAKEVANLTGISANSVKTARSRLRRKLGITDPNDSLFEFLSKY